MSNTPEQTAISPADKPIKKFQFEFVEEPNGSLTLRVYDPIAFDNWDGKDIVDILDKLDIQGPLMRVLISMIMGASMHEEVHKIIDVRTGRERDVTKTTLKSMMKKFDTSYIRSKYDERVEKGVIDPEEFPFDEFEKVFRKNNE